MEKCSKKSKPCSNSCSGTVSLTVTDHFLYTSVLSQMELHASAEQTRNQKLSAAQQCWLSAENSGLRFRGCMTYCRGFDKQNQREWFSVENQKQSSNRNHESAKTYTTKTLFISNKTFQKQNKTIFQKSTHFEDKQLQTCIMECFLTLYRSHTRSSYKSRKSVKHSQHQWCIGITI